MVIIEDEPLATERLQYLLQQYDPHSKVAASLESIDEAVKWFSDNPPPDLILSDIQLSDGSAFEIFKKIKSRPETPIFDLFQKLGLKITSEEVYNVTNKFTCPSSTHVPYFSIK